MSTRRKRRIHIDGKEWIYLVIHDMIEIRDINNKKYLVNIVHMPGNEGWTNDNMERAKWKGNPLPVVTPGSVKYYIETKILNKSLPEFTFTVDDTDHRQDAINEKHWAGKIHRNLCYKISYGLNKKISGEKNHFQEEPEKNSLSAVPLEIIRQSLKDIQHPVELLKFELVVDKEIKDDSVLYAYPRFENGENIYAVYSGRFGANKNSYFSFIEI